MHLTTKIMIWFGWHGGYELLVNMVADFHEEFPDFEQDVKNVKKRRVE